MTETTTPDDWRYWLALRLVRGVGPVTYKALLRAFGGPQRVFDADHAAIRAAGGSDAVARGVRAFAQWQQVDRQLAQAARVGAQVVTWQDERYPALLREVHDPPPFLFVRGTLTPHDAHGVAVVGSRRASAYGKRMAQQIATGLAQAELTVVSGLARGIDAVAHRAALHAGGRTIAVLGSGVDVIYPGEHHALSEEIVQHGAVCSELWMGTKPEAENFPSRNRIISGMTLGTVVVEAAEKSGSLITARLAAEHGREVFAVPGQSGSATRGTHALIRQGAKLTETAQDVLEEIAPQYVLPMSTERSGTAATMPTSAPAIDIDPTEAAVLETLQGDTVHIDTIIGQVQVAPAVVLQVLLGLELKGVVQQQPGKYFVALPVDVRRVPTQD